VPELDSPSARRSEFVSSPAEGTETAVPVRDPHATGDGASPLPPPVPTGSAAVPRRRRWPWWVLRGVLVALIVPGLILAAAELATPSVSDAPARVTAIDAAHRSTPVQVAPSWKVVQAVVAAEDASFYTNHGIDVPGMLRALWGRVTGVDLGGSTISEQLAKVLYEQGSSGVFERVSEVALALKLRGHFSPVAVLSMYLSAVYYGHGYYGLRAASEGYFQLPPDRLSWAQAALLAGLPQSPTQLDPLVHLAQARHRQAYVLDQLVDTGVITQAQAAAAARAPLGLR
jgi:membrane peptidoglycan carboxypeptidase